MNKNKIQQIICGGTLIATALNMTPAFAYQKENTTLIKVESNDITKDNIQLLSDSYDDEDFEVEQYGQIIVKHVDIDTGKEIYSRDVYDDVPYGETTVYSRLNISGYVLQDDRVKIANVSASNPIVTIVFKYKSTTPVTPPVTPPVTTPPTTPNTGTDNNSGSTQNPSTGTGSSSNNNTSTQKPSTGTSNTNQNSNANNSNNTQKPTTSNSILNNMKVEVATEEENVVLGSVTINYVNINTGEVFKTVKEDNLSLTDSYTYSGTDEIGYTLHDKSSKTVTLSEDNPNVVINFNYIKNDSVATFGRSRLQEAYDSDKSFTSYSATGSISVGESLLKYILDNQKEDLILNVGDGISNIEVMEELSSSYGLNILSTFSISSNIEGEDLKESIVVSKNVDAEYNDKSVYIYKLLSDNTVEYVGENIVTEGVVSFDADLPLIGENEEIASTEYFISDVEFNENVEDEVIVDTQDITSEKSSSSLFVYVSAAIIACAGAILAGLKLFKGNKEETKDKEE